MLKRNLGYLLVMILAASFLAGCDSGTAAGGARPANAPKGPGKPPGMAGAGG